MTTSGWLQKWERGGSLHNSPVYIYEGFKLCIIKGRAALSDRLSRRLSLLDSSTPLSKYGHLWLQKKRDGDCRNAKLKALKWESTTQQVNRPSYSFPILSDEDIEYKVVTEPVSVVKAQSHHACLNGDQKKY